MRLDQDEIGRDAAQAHGAEFRGRPTASGEPFDPSGRTAAHRTLPLGTWLTVRSPNTGRSIEVRVNDRGPIPERVEIDLSYEAARRLGIDRAGVAEVELQAVAAPSMASPMGATTGVTVPAAP